MMMMMMILSSWSRLLWNQVIKELPSPVRTTAAVQSLPVYDKLTALVSNNAVVVFTITGCCMCHVVKQLLFGLGVGPTIVELDRDASGTDIHALLFRLSGAAGVQPQLVVPAVFVGGKFLGGIESVMACHINGTLVPLLRDAGALWL